MDNPTRHSYSCKYLKWGLENKFVLKRLNLVVVGKFPRYLA